jgi:pimeloyl-ACP methyl ester carboxylesterase
MSEKIIQFGDENRLSGILTIAETASADAPAIIILSAGITPRVGPNRLHVSLARNFADSGFSALRFDMSGLGESLPPPPGLGYEAQSIEDVKDAVAVVNDVLGDRPVILAGLCSGADNGYRAALEIEGVAGLIMLDPYAYQHPAAKRAYLTKRAQDPEKLGEFIGNLSSRLSRMGRAAEEQGDDEIDLENDRIAPPLEQFGADMQILCQRGVQTSIIYTHSVHHMINKAEQFFDTFKGFEFSDRLDVQVFGDADHTYTELAVRQKLIDHLCDWLKERF